ncbi:MAG: cytochrome P450 [Verrucomicrobiales bacterium]
MSTAKASSKTKARVLPPPVLKPRHWLMGSAYYIRKDPLRWIPEWASAHGPVFMIESPLGNATVVGDPQLARKVMSEQYPTFIEKGMSYVVLKQLLGNGLVTSSGEFWRAQRKLTQPAFHRSRLQAIFRMMVQRSEEAVERLGAAAQETDLAPFFSELTLDVISRAMFSTDVGDNAAAVGSHIAILNEKAIDALRQPWRLFLPKTFPTPFNAVEFEAMASLNSIIHGIIEERRRKDSDAHDDLLGMFLSACDEETGQGMTNEQLRDEVMTIFVAGHETTANAMCWLLYLLSLHPDASERLRAEIDSAGDALASGNTEAFPYLRRVIEESLRLYPTIWAVGRRSVHDDELGGFFIRKGTTVVLPIFHYHWSEEHWQNPAHFDPDRFLPERNPPLDAYMPFGAGPRGCIGKQFALQELLIMTAVFLKKFRVLPVPGFEVKPDPLITLRPKHGMLLRLLPNQSL